MQRLYQSPVHPYLVKITLQLATISLKLSVAQPSTIEGVAAQKEARRNYLLPKCLSTGLT